MRTLIYLIPLLMVMPQPTSLSISDSDSNWNIPEMLKAFAISWITYPRHDIHDVDVTVMGDIRYARSSDNDSVSITVFEASDGTGTVEWRLRDSVVLSASFPINLELITEKTKPELEELFVSELLGYKYDSPVISPHPPVYTYQGDGIFISEGDFYILPKVRNDTYYKFTSGKYVPLLSRKHPMESIINILSLPNENRFSVLLTINKYGFTRDTVKVPLQSLIRFCLSQNCIPYVGIESQNDDIITATLFMVNKRLYFNHLFKVTLNTSILEKKTGTINMDARVFIPVNPNDNLYYEEPGNNEN